MSQKKEFEWTDRTHSAKGLIHNYRERLPVIAKVVQGFCGIDDDDEYAYSAGEVYRLEAVREQNKLIFRNGQSQFFSVPEACPYRFQILYDKGEKGALMSLHDIQERLDVGMKVEMEEDEERRFKLPVLGESHQVSASLGILQYEDFYTETVLVGRPVIEATPQSEEVLIPSFVDIQLSLASGLESGSIEDYNKVCADITQMCATLESSADNYTEEIMLVTCDIDELTDEYKNITPVHYVRCDQIVRSRETQESVEKLSKKMVSSDAYITARPANPTRRPVKPPTAPTLTISPGVGSSEDDLDYAMPTSMTSDVPPPLPPPPEHLKKVPQNRGRLPAPPPMEDTDSSKRTSLSPNVVHLPKSQRPTSPACNKPPPVLVTGVKTTSTKHDYINKVNPVSPLKAAGEIYTCIDDEDDDAYSLPEDYIKMHPTAKQHPVGRSQSTSSSTIASPTSRTSEDNSYGSFADVPKQVSTMSVAEVGSCLKLMKLDKHIDRFDEENIDGSMLLEIDKSMLMDDFNFTAFESKKLMKFISGWRPNTSTL